MFEFDWLDPGETRGAELSATWAQLKIHFDDQVVTRVYDSVSRSVRDRIHVPLYPLAEWIVYNWWFLLHEVYVVGVSSDYNRRHNLRAASEGYPLPSMTVYPLGEDSVRIQWSDYQPSYGTISYLSRGVYHLSLADFREQLRDFVNSVTTRLSEMGVEDTPLQSEWSFLQRSSDEEEEFSIAAAALGRDPYSLSESDQALLIEVSARLPDSVRSEFFRAINFEQLQQSASGLARLLTRLEKSDKTIAALRDIRQEFMIETISSTPNQLPWEYGYTCARELRRVLGLNGQPLPSSTTLLHTLGLKARRLTEVAVSVPAEATAIDGAVQLNADLEPTFAFRSRSESSNRFTFCREIFEYFRSQDATVNLVTPAQSERQKQNRAFAAEFLAPSVALRARVHGNIVSDEQVEDMGKEFGVSPQVIVHQLSNHQIAQLVYV